MKKRFRFLVFFCIAFIVVFVTSCTRYEQSIECLAPIQKEVLVIAEFGQIRNLDNEKVGIGVVSFKVGDTLYAMGHYSSLEDISSLSVYKVLPTFDSSTKKHLGSVTCNGDFEELLGGITQNSNDGMIISAEEFETEIYSNITVANDIYSGDAQLLMRDETGELQSYSISVKVVKSKAEEHLEISVTDKRLLSKTGGIIQGMSGSPIIQDGKLIGVVTHAYVHRPWEGKGKIIWDIDCINNYTGNN